MTFTILWLTKNGEQVWQEYVYRPVWGDTFDEYRFKVIMCGMNNGLSCLEAPNPVWQSVTETAPEADAGRRLWAAALARQMAASRTSRPPMPEA